MVSAVSGSTAALQGQIKRDQLDLNDWVTCVSAKTPKGKAEIQKISGEISSAKERLARVAASEAASATSASGAPATASASATPSLTSAASATTPSHSGALEAGAHGGLIDVWA
jgi:peptidoglycan hydrolase CwlO-like protein